MRELCFNLWYKIDANGMIISIAGRAYLLEGTDKDKTAVLANLSDQDYKAVDFMPVPRNIRSIFKNGVQYSMFDQIRIDEFYKEVFAAIRASITPDVPFPDDKLYHFTPLFDFGDGYVPAEIGKNFIRKRVLDS